MNTVIAETESPFEIEFHKAGIPRISVETEQIFANSEASQRRIDALVASTQVRLDHIKEMIRSRDPSANLFS